MYVLCFAITTVFYVFFFRGWRRLFGFTFFALTSFYVIMFLWIPYYALCNAILDVSWEYPIQISTMWMISSAFWVCCVISELLRFALLPARSLIQPRAISACVVGLRGRFYTAYALTGVSISIIALAGMKGVTLDVGNYGTRFESNTGTGLYSVLSFSLVSLLVAHLYRSPTKSSFVKVLLIAMAYGAFLFLILGGARNYLVAAIVPLLLVAYRMRIVSLSLLGVLGLCGVLLIAALALVRYGDSFGAGSVELLAVYTRDTMFPVGSLSGILDSTIHFVGFEYFFNQFSAVVPRAVWSDKPIYLDTIAYYYTEQMLGYGKGLVIAPTGIGSLYIMGGWPFVLVGPVVIVGFTTILDYLSLRRSAAFYVCAFPSVFFAFFCFRESVELGVYKILIHTIFAMLVLLASRTTCALLTTRRKALCGPNDR